MGFSIFKLHIRKVHASSDRGFTLVELIVVLALMAILLSITAFGSISWLDWSRFQQEDSYAESIFYATQNQITEMDASGALDQKMDMLRNSAGSFDSIYVLAHGKDSAAGFSGYYDTNGNLYEWNKLWKDKNLDKEERTLLHLTADATDYDDYLDDPSNVDPGTRVLFDLIGAIISDKKVLNGSIAIEFSPEAAQVFAVCYSDQADGFEYRDTTAAGRVDIRNRKLQIRKDEMVGYYAVDSLTMKLKGKSRNSAGYTLELENEDYFSMILHPRDEVKLEEAKLTFTINGASTYAGNYDKQFTFVIDGSDEDTSDDITAKNLTDALDNPLNVKCDFSKGLYADTDDRVFRIPVWKDDATGYVHIILDAADIQAQSLLYAQSLGGIAGISDAEKTQAQENFRRTFSFYRFGLPNVRFLRADVLVASSSGNGGGSAGRRVGGEVIPYGTNGILGEAVTFANWDSKDTDQTYGILNGRHFYNIRFESDYSDEFKMFEIYSDGDAKSREFVLKSNIDWASYAYLTNSFPTSLGGVTSGTYGIGLNPLELPRELYYEESDGTKVSPGTDMKKYPFPSFRMLSYSDKFTQEKDPSADDDYFSISGLNISLAANCIYGIYGEDVQDCFRDSSTMSKAFRMDNSSSYDTLIQYGKAGMLALGLFAENGGELSNLEIDRIQVRGVEGFPVSTPDKYLVASRVGGFVGENLGTLTKLYIDERRAKGTKAESWIRGRSDVGGIVGHQYWIVKKKGEVASTITNDNPYPDTTITISGCVNNAKVTGIGYVGGIIGRIYPKGADSFDVQCRIGDTDKRYNTWYLTILHEKLFSMSVAERNVIEGCKNHGEISMDPSYAEKEIDGNSFRRGYYFGGIAGAAFQSQYTAGNSLNYDFSSNANKRAVIKNCDSDTLYTKTDLMKILNPGNDGENMKEAKRFLRMQFVGGIVGGAAYAYIEDCSTTPSGENKGKYSFLFGDRYVGGVAGYAVETTFTGSDTYNKNEFVKLVELGLTGERSKYRSDYSVINGTGVYGNYAIGGIAGAFGIPEGEHDGDLIVKSGLEAAYSGSYSDGQKTVTMGIGYPAGCGASISSQHAITGLLNTSVVLGGSFNAKVNSNENLVGAETTDRCYYGIGGVAGVLATTIRNADYVQSEATKSFYYGLICTGITNAPTDVSKLTAVDKLCTIVENSLFVTDGTGGIVGEALRNGNLNSALGKARYSSTIDAVIFGRNRVGGAIGDNSASISSGGQSVVANMYPSKVNSGSSGLVVFGYENVGGLVGAFSDNGGNGVTASFNSDDNIFKNGNNDVIITTPFRVLGYRAVGGAIGTFYADDGKEAKVTAKIKIEASAVITGSMYVGGAIGIQEGYSKSNARYILRLQNTSVRADCFAGSIAGAILSDRGYWPLDKLTDNTTNSKVNNAKAEADICAGFVTGLYAYQGTPGENVDSNSVLWNTTGENGIQNYKRYDDGSHNGLYNITKINNLKCTVPDSFDENTYLEFIKGIKGVYNDLLVPTAGIVIDMQGFCEKVQEKGGIVSAKLYVGGLCGYIPERIVSDSDIEAGRTLTIYYYRNRSRLRTSGAVRSCEIGSNDENYYSYLGAVTGRIPPGMKLSSCKNTSGSQPSEEAVGNYYAKSTNTSFVGGLTEVNAGWIEYAGYLNASTNKLYFDDKAMNSKVYYIENINGGVGYVAGLNGTSITDGVYTGVICNSADVYWLRGKTVGGIAAAAGGSSTIRDCVSHGDITVIKNNNASGDKGAAGILYEVSDFVPAGKTIVLSDNSSSCKTTIDKSCDGAKITGIVYNTRGKGDVIRCRNYTPELSYAITSSEVGKRANSIIYCIDASNSAEKSSDKYTGFGMTTGNLDSMYGNLYIGKKTGQTQYFAVNSMYVNNFADYDGKALTDADLKVPIRTYDELPSRTRIESQIQGNAGWEDSLKNSDDTGYRGVEINVVDGSGHSNGTYADVDAITIRWNKGSVDETYQNQMILYDADGKRMSIGQILTSVSSGSDFDQKVDISEYWNNRATNGIRYDSGFNIDQISKIVIIVCGATNGSGTIGIKGLSWNTTRAGQAVSVPMIFDPSRNVSSLTDALEEVEKDQLSMLYFEETAANQPHLYLNGVSTGISAIDVDRRAAADQHDPPKIELVNTDGSQQYFSEDYLNNSQTFRQNNSFADIANIASAADRSNIPIPRFNFYRYLDMEHRLPAIYYPDTTP
ncbi:MAG: type II secretion system protein [Eubacterium sp.]|nr:type II secretion system protein [Eubacterium sp.]